MYKRLRYKSNKSNAKCHSAAPGALILSTLGRPHLSANAFLCYLSGKEGAKMAGIRCINYDLVGVYCRADGKNYRSTLAW